MLRAIGVVRSPVVDRHAMPGQGVRAVIEVLPEYATELEGIELSSHLVVLAHMHVAHLPLRHAERRTALADLPARGVFATRSPRRPNPISVSVVRLLGRDGGRLELENLDLIDGTTVLDLKPYLPGLDAVFGATRGWRSRTNRGSERMLGYLRQELDNHLGPHSADVGALAGLAAVMQAVERLGVDPRDPSLAVRVNRADATADALMALLGATLSSGRIALAPDERPLELEFRSGAARIRIATGPGGDLVAGPVEALPGGE